MGIAEMYLLRAIFVEFPICKTIGMMFMYMNTMVHFVLQ